MGIKHIFEKEITLGTIIDYILEYFPELKFWNGISKHETYTNGKTYMHRQGMPNEIRIEFDGNDRVKNFENAHLTCCEMYKRKLSFAVYYVEGGRSPHIHIYECDELENLTLENRTKYREMFIDEVCPKNSNADKGLCNETHLCALEFVNHFKYKKPKQLLCYYNQGILSNQGCDYRLIVKLDKKKAGNKEKNQTQINFGTKLRDTIISRLNFEKVFKKYDIEFKGSKALCPFHADSDMSLSFSNKKGLWNCFGCDKKGDIISLIKYLEEGNGENRGN